MLNGKNRALHKVERMDKRTARTEWICVSLHGDCSAFFSFFFSFVRCFCVHLFHYILQRLEIYFRRCSACHLQQQQQHHPQCYKQNKDLKKKKKCLMLTKFVKCLKQFSCFIFHSTIDIDNNGHRRRMCER